VPLYQSHAFVLRTYKLGESDQIVVFFTQEYGKIRAVGRRSHSPRRRLSNYCQPLCLLNAILFGRPAQSLFRINSVDIVHPFRSIQEDFACLRSGLYLTELVDVATREHEPLPELFALMRWGLNQLTEVEHPAMLLRLFEVRLLMLMGYTPQLSFCVNCMRDLPLAEGLFSPYLGGLICATCAPSIQRTIKVSGLTIGVLRQMIDNGSEVCLDRLSARPIEAELENLLHAHLVARLERELKSYPFLQL
jgi:DNA repair protein RecO (recombination protein O)